MIRAKSALAGAGALVLAGALAAGVAHAAGPAAARPSTAHPARTTWVGSWGSVPTTVPPASTTMFSNQTIRQTVLRTAAEQSSLTTPNDEAKKQIEAWRKTAQRYQTEPETGEGRDELMARAKEAEKKRDRSMAAYHQYELASAAVQIAIVLASASIIAEIAALAWAGAALGVVGIVFCVIGFVFPTAVHLF